MDPKVPSGSTRFIEVNGLRLHLVDHGGSGKPLLLFHGLSGNAHLFDGLVGAGLARAARVLALDLRGRGLSDKPDRGYRMADHAADVLAVMDTLGLERIALGGHSFGGLLALYLGATAPERVDRLVILDASTSFDPEVRELIRPSLARLDTIIPSWEAYRDAMRRQPFLEGRWDAVLEGYYRAEVETLPRGGVRPRADAAAVWQVTDLVRLGEPWDRHLAQVVAPVLVINALGGYGPPGSPPVLPQELALELVAVLVRGSQLALEGNHITMLFEPHAPVTAAVIASFLAAD